MFGRFAITIAAAAGVYAITLAAPVLAASYDVPMALSTNLGKMTAPYPAPADHIRLARRSASLPVTVVPRPSIAPPASLGVFDSVAISVAKLPAANKWRRVSDKNYTALFGTDCADSGLDGCNADLTRTLRTLARKAEGRSARAVLNLVNRSVNTALAYRPDAKLWGRGDYWATPSEIATRGAGDCEDFAITKYWLLRSLGISSEHLQLVVLQDTRRQLFHAVLVVHVDGEKYVLDNVSSRLARDTAYANYQPIMSFSGERNFIHGFASGSSRAMAAMPKNLASVAPGEGL